MDHCDVHLEFVRTSKCEFPPVFSLDILLNSSISSEEKETCESYRSVPIYIIHLNEFCHPLILIHDDNHHYGQRRRVGKHGVLCTQQTAAAAEYRFCMSQKTFHF